MYTPFRLSLLSTLLLAGVSHAETAVPESAGDELETVVVTAS